MDQTEDSIIFNQHLIYTNIYKNLDLKTLIKLYDIPFFMPSVSSYIKKDIEEVSLHNYILNTLCQPIREFENKVYWRHKCLPDQKLSEDFIREFTPDDVWRCISRYYKPSETFIKDFEDKIDWDCVSKFSTLSEDFIREFKYKVNWKYISEEQVLSEDFIREFKDKVDWSIISKHQRLSEPFIREFRRTVNWKRIAKYQRLSDSFIEEFAIRLFKYLY